MKLLKQMTALLLTMAMALSLAACSGGADTKKNVAATQSVSMLMGLDVAGVNRYSGVAEAKSSQKVEKDSEKTVAECLVEVGQEVHAGDVLFRYDVEAMRLSVESAKLELEQLQNQVNSYERQIAQLEKEKKSASKSEQLSYTLQIQEAQLDQAEAQYNLKQKQMEMEKLEKSTENADVCAEVDGVVQSINENGSGGDYYGYGESDNAYITIMETGTYRIKGSVSENNVYALYEGMEVTVQSRTDPGMTWSGTVSEINTGSTEEENNNGGYYEENNGENASKYSFYVELTDSEGMMMGQHVYILPYALDRSNGTGVVLPASFVVDPEGAAYVWAAGSKDTLEKRSVTLGAYDDVLMTYAIESGLTTEDYIADPASALTEGQAVVKYDASSYGFGSGDATEEGGLPAEDGDFIEDGAMEEGFYEGGDFGDMSAWPEDGAFYQGEGNAEMWSEGEAEADIADTAVEGPVMEG